MWGENSGCVCVGGGGVTGGGGRGVISGSKGGGNPRRWREVSGDGGGGEISRVRVGGVPGGVCVWAGDLRRRGGGRSQEVGKGGGFPGGRGRRGRDST